jgi:hypothetical protein
MTPFRCLLITSVCGCLTIATPALAGSMRCGTNLIQSGRDGVYEVLKKCGEPTARLGYTWIYESPGKRKRVLQFDGQGILRDIKVE